MDAPDGGRWRLRVNAARFGRNRRNGYRSGYRCRQPLKAAIVESPTLLADAVTGGDDYELSLPLRLNTSKC